MQKKDSQIKIKILNCINPTMCVNLSTVLLRVILYSYSRHLLIVDGRRQPRLPFYIH